MFVAPSKTFGMPQTQIPFHAFQSGSVSLSTILDSKWLDVPDTFSILLNTSVT
jgi:hypothetical protein